MTRSTPHVQPRATEVELTEDELKVDLADGRRITVPLAWFPRLLNASPEALARWELLGNGQRIRWADLHEDISVAELLRTA